MILIVLTALNWVVVRPAICVVESPEIWVAVRAAISDVFKVANLVELMPPNCAVVRALICPVCRAFSWADVRLAT